LIVDVSSNVVVMEYEAGSDPKRSLPRHCGHAPAPISRHAFRRGGYDSADPAVIRKHVAQLEQLGVDAALIDLTNNVSCIFDSEWFVRDM